MIATNFVSACCRTEIIIQTKLDRSPLGHKEYNGGGICYKIDVCSSCGKEAEPVAVTECCGMEICECELEALRTELVDKGIKLGVNDPEVIALSKRFDELHNEINRNEARA